MTFSLMSNKYITGGSKIIITAPKGFGFTCKFFRTDSGLASTTTCFVLDSGTNSRGVTTRSSAEFMIDSQDPKPKNSPFKLFVYVSNPEFTPQPNKWDFSIISPLGEYIDIREHVTGFDITGRLPTGVSASFPYKGEQNTLSVVFVPTTIMNQADNGNELVVTAPSGYVFDTDCGNTAFKFRHTTAPDEGQQSAYTTFVFPPPGTTCVGTNNVVIIRLPNGYGLLKNNYTLEMSVTNPPDVFNSSTWQFMTRVSNPQLGSRIVDINRTIEGFDLRTIRAVDLSEEGASLRVSHLAWPLLGALVALGATF